MHKESFIRWQSITIQQLGHSINLALVLATASLGFAFNLAKDCDFHTRCWSKTLLSLSLLLLILSVGLGIAGTLNRLCDFRKTTHIAHDREQWTKDGVAEAEIDSRLCLRRSETKRLGDRTWWCFYGQIGTFGVGILLLIFALGIVYHAKLF
jgi:hypothetical protein